LAARYTLCPKCSYPIPEGASHCPHRGAPVRAPEPATNPFPPPRRLRPREPLVKRAYKAMFERYRGVVVSALLGILLLINIITLVLAVPYVKEEGSGGKFVESIATLEVPGNPLEDTFNVSYEVWPGERVPSSGMTLLNITLNTSSFILPPTVRLTTVEGGVAGEARLFVERAAKGILLHALFYPLPPAGYYTVTVEGLGGAEVNVGEVLIEGDGITERLINDPFYPIGEGIETNLPEGFVLYLNGTPTLPSELNGLLSGDWQTLTVKQLFHCEGLPVSAQKPVQLRWEGGGPVEIKNEALGEVRLDTLPNRIKRVVYESLCDSIPFYEDLTDVHLRPPKTLHRYSIIASGG